MTSYLKDFHKRMNSIAIPYKLAQYCKNNVKTYRKNSISDELFFLFIHYVLLFIEDCNVKQKFCTKDMVSAELKKIGTCLSIEIDTYELASDIVNHCCENDGNRLLFDAQNDIMKPFDIHLIEGRYEFREGRYITGYELTPQCLDYIYATKEIAELGRVSIEQIKLEKAIKAGNFVEARSNVDNLIMAIETQKKAIKIKEKIIFTNILSLEVSEVMKDMNETLRMIASQRNDSLNIKNLLDAQATIDETGSINRKEVELAFTDIYYVKDRLNRILGLQMNLISVLQDFLVKFKTELVSADFITETSSINIMEDIIRPLEEDIKGIVNPFQILLPFFHLSKKNKFNLGSVFNEQSILKNEIDGDAYIEKVNLEDSVLDNTEEIQKNNQEYEALFLLILQKTLDHEKISLSEIVSSSHEFGNHLTASKVVLTSLLYEREIVFDNMNSFRSSGDVEVFFPEILHQKGGLLLEGKKLVMKTDPLKEVIIEEIKEEMGIKTMIKVPDIYFEIMGVEEN